MFAKEICLFSERNMQSRNFGNASNPMLEDALPKALCREIYVSSSTSSSTTPPSDIPCNVYWLCMCWKYSHFTHVTAAPSMTFACWTSSELILPWLVAQFSLQGRFDIHGYPASSTSCKPPLPEPPPPGPKILLLRTSEFKWVLVSSSEFQSVQVSSRESQCDLVNSIKFQWIQVSSSEFNRAHVNSREI